MEAKLVGTRNLSMSHGTNKNGKMLLQKSKINEFKRFFSMTLIQTVQMTSIVPGATNKINLYVPFLI